MKRREVIALISALLMLCTNVLVYPLSKKDMALKGALIEQPSSPEYKSRDDYFKELMEKTEKLRQEQEYQQKKAEEERKKRELENKPKINNEKIHKTNNNQEMHIARDRSVQKIKLTLSFYGSGEEQNGIGNGNLTASGKKPYYGVIASNNFKLGAKMYINGYGEFTVLDTGSPNYLRRLEDGSIKVDVFIPRNRNESANEYKRRIMKMGIVKTDGWIVN